MPQGVEHAHRDGICSRDALVRIPLMPQGVEHSSWACHATSHAQVRIPLMPQGVEHSGTLRPSIALAA